MTRELDARLLIVYRTARLEGALVLASILTIENVALSAQYQIMTCKMCHVTLEE